MTDRKQRSSATQSAPGTPRIGRRGFFGASLSLAAASLAGGALPAMASEAGDQRTKTRYQPESAHVKDYYHVNRLVWPEKK